MFSQIQKNVLPKIFSAFAVTVIFAASAVASPVLFCKDGPGIDLVGSGCISGTAPGYPGGGDGIYDNAGGGDPEAKVEQAILQATGSIVDLVLYGKSDANPGLFSFTPNSGANLVASLSGAWSVLDGTAISYITIKAANSFALYKISPASASGVYSTIGMLTNGGQQPTVSHISFWTSSSSSVPEPMTGALLLMGCAPLLRKRFFSKK